MGFLTPSMPNVVIDTKPAFTALQMQSSTAGLPIPLLWGVIRIAPNLLWYGDFGAVAHTQTTGGGGGGKGGGGGGGAVTQTTYTYKAAFAFALCEGEVSAVPLCWQNKAVYDPIAGLGFSLISGRLEQAAWSYLSINHPAETLEYSGTAMLVTPYYDMGSGSSLPNHNFEVHGSLKGTLADIGNLVDADVGLLVKDFLTNEYYGAGFPESFIDMGSLTGGAGTSSWSAFCRTIGVGLSPALCTQEAARDILTRWMTITNTEAVWTGSQIRFVPLFAYSLTASGGRAWTAPTALVFDLSDEDYVSDGVTDPVTLARTDTADAHNVVRIEILDRNNSYNVAVVEQRDDAHILKYGLRIMPTIQAHEITSAAMAGTVASLILQRSLIQRNIYTFNLSWEYCMLEPLDAGLLTDAWLGLDAQPVRIRSVEENDDFTLTITAEDFPQGMGSVTNYAVQTAAPTVVSDNTPAASANAPLIFEPSAAVVGATPQVWIAASGGTGGMADPLWGGCEIWVSPDNVTYSKIGTITLPAMMGFLTSALASYSGAAPDNANTLSVDCSESGAQLASTTAAIAAAGGNECWVDGEIMTFASATMTGTSQYALAQLYRGMRATAIGAHGIGSKFCMLDARIFKYDIPASYIGKTLYLKFPSFNIWGKALQDMAALTPYTYLVTGAGASLQSCPIFSALLAGQIYDCGLAGTSVPALGDCGVTSSSSIGTINLGARP